MVDGITIYIGIEEWQALTLILNFDLQYAHSPTSTEIYFKYVGTLKNLVLEVRFKNGDFTLTVRGSLHKLFHNNNSSDFFLHELDRAVNQIYQALNISAVTINSIGGFDSLAQIPLSLTKVEVGVNIEVGIDELQRFCVLNLIQHKKQPFHCEDGLVYVCKHENYYLKIYPKERNLLRVEIVFLSNELRKFKVKVLSELTRVTVGSMALRLKKEFEEIIFGEGLNLHSATLLTKQEELKLLKFTNDWRNRQYREDLKQSSPREKKNYQQRMWRLGVQSKKILKEKGAGYQEIVNEALRNKIDYLFS